ncbi:ATP-binding protein [Flavihumibacter profundi]|uniref:ATP-binding protein n=1 Tax=Flavihumibacter profundi TaxID=2716883 RepID=UPI001CC61991|nr:ATP-binding protein [Flavihumibacter profundi]MBZ5858416.1 ATP-binding protein [Flavihumibacter profundi]
MKTTDLNHICPYTGLRSFTEEESLYFKGRDLQVDQITALLEQNKFLMVTGASGEGKSSLIYAGLIPNARAGFFKARYSNWLVAGFRPERNPVRNMAAAVAEQLQLSVDTVETELRRGYSSLIDLYLNSSFYAGEEEVSLEKKRKSANLMILVDQFEEFFTNPENFFNDVHSKDAQIVVNLLLETARIAISRNLPVYVVCTMRSDYIGQCSSFRGLPEYIGFSQFFVPRLKRKDLKQVIEEPAILSGNRISQRLIERLVYDIADGVDQLPILQHALSRIWQAADNGREEMDLLHYAMVGGMPADDLPDEDRVKFTNWLATIPEQQQKFYAETGLHKVIEIHASLLYENAWNYYNQQHPDSPVSQRDAKRIIALTFSCLTKYDNSRAVRNRMTLAEITSIINTPHLSPEVVGGVINIYREEGNSFIRPFKTDDPKTHDLSPETVLDITHESLIRNWNKLNSWANREYEFYSTYLDFQKQVDRWKNSGKSSGYLLPIGPLTYFENWYNNCKPNTGWLRRYGGITGDPAESLHTAEADLGDIKEFLKKSARKEMVTRAFMKYGARRITAILAIMIMLVLTGFYWYDAEQKKNENVIKRVRKEASALLNSQEVNIQDKAVYMLAEERYQQGSLVPALEARDFKSRVKIAVESYKQLLLQEKHLEGDLKNQLFSLITKNLMNPDPAADPEFLLLEGNKFTALLAMDKYYLPDPKKEEVLAAIAEKNYQLVMRFLGNKKLYLPTIPIELNMAIQYWLTVGKASPEQIKNLLALVSPLSSKEGEAVFNLYYPKGSFETNGRLANDFNGGYHTLASLYAAAGETDHITWCFRQLLDNNQRDYFELPRILNSHLNIIGYLYQYGHQKEAISLMQWISSNTRDNSPQVQLRNVVIRSGYITHMYLLNVIRNYHRSTRGYVFPNLYLSDRAVFDEEMADYDSTLKQIPNPSERNFELAMNYKRKAMFYHKYWWDRNMPVDEVKLDGYLKAAVDLYGQVSKDSLDAMISTTVVYNGDGVRTKLISRHDLFIYPDYRDGWFSWTFHSDYFFNYLRKNGLLSQLYKTGNDLQAIHYWVAKAFETKADISPEAYSKNYSLPDSTLQNIISFTDQHPEGKAFDKNLLLLVLANRAFDRGDSLEGMKYTGLLDLQNIHRSKDKYEYLEKVFFLNLMRQLAEHLAELGKMEKSVSIAELFEENHEKVLGYLHIAEKLYRQNANPKAFVYLDSAYANIAKLDYAKLDARLDPRVDQILVLSEIGSKSVNTHASEILRDIPEGGKFFGIYYQVLGVSYEGNYYRALTSLPSTLTESQDLVCRTLILLEACRVRERQTGDQKWTSFDKNLLWDINYLNYLPN